VRAVPNMADRILQFLDFRFSRYVAQDFVNDLEIILIAGIPYFYVPHACIYIVTLLRIL
jgi:hypothetical protein